MLTCRDGRHCPRIATATKRATITALVLVSMLGSVLVSAASAQTGGSGPPAAQVARYGAGDRYSTSLEIADEFATRSGRTLDHVVMVSGDVWLDAVVASAYAASLSAPIVMTPSVELRGDTTDFLRRVKARQVDIVAGGTRPNFNVSNSVLVRLDQEGYNVTLISGADRYLLSVAVASSLGAPGSLKSSGRSVIIASGQVFADALVAGPLSYKAGVPVLLTPRDYLHPEVAAYLRETQVSHVMLMGGTAALSASVEADIRGLGIVNVDRMDGRDRYETATKTARYAADSFSGECFDGSRVGLARGDVPFDAFSAAALLAQQCAPLVLTETNDLPESTAQYLDEIRRTTSPSAVQVSVFGGPSAVSERVLRALTGQAEPKTARFTAVSAGTNFACALRGDGTLACWGQNDAGQAMAPPGQFIAVSTGWRTACAVRTSGSLECWGSNRVGQSDPPRGRYTAVALGDETGCAAPINGPLACWGYRKPSGPLLESLGQIKAVSTGAGTVCAVGVNGDLGCRALQQFGMKIAPTGSYVSVSIGGLYRACALQVQGTLVCWQTGPGPYGFPSNDLTLLPVPLGRFKTVSAGSRAACAVRINAELACWDMESGDSADFLQAGATPQGTFQSVSVGWTISFDHSANQFACAVHTSGELECWGDNDHRLTEVPLR